MISVKIRTTPTDLAKRISEAPIGARGKMAEEAAVYMLYGNAATRADIYPAKPPKSTYQRTFKLREGWGYMNYGSKIKVTNPVPYAKYVVGDNTQAKIHQGRWRTLSKIVAQNTKGMILAAEAALQSYLKSKGLSK